jgi:SAM-dependent methyltransferase
MHNAAAYWGSHAGYAMNWFQFCAPYINERVTGNAALSPTPWALSISGKPKHLLEIGCLDGRKIAAYQAKRIIERGSGVDIAVEAIERGRAAYPDLTLSVCDLNAPDLPRAAYDVILSNGVLHHIENIEACVRSLYDALEPGGWLFASEFTGPRRYAYGEEETEIIRRGQRSLPAKLRGAPFHPNQLAKKLESDPSESISTAIIEPTLRSVFDEVMVRPFGGNVLFRALTKDFYAGFDADNAEHRAAFEALQNMDREVSAEHGSHHCFFLARKAA